MTKPKISVSILSADFAHLAEEVKACEAAGVDMLHIDVMDGHFVPNLTIGPVIIQAIRPLTRLPIDAHLMIDNPWLYIEDYAKAGSDIITLHAESYDLNIPKVDKIRNKPRIAKKINVKALKRDIAAIRKLDRKVGLTLNPGTKVEVIKALLPLVDKVLVMSVNPGFAGQKFMPEVIPKIRKLNVERRKPASPARLAKRAGRLNAGFEIEIDGGINDKTAPLAVKAGVDILATASYFFGAADKTAAVVALKENG